MKEMKSDGGKEGKRVRVRAGEGGRMKKTLM